MLPLVPRPTLLVDPWGFRIVDPDGNVIGKEDSIYTYDSAGNVTGILAPPGVERLVRALPLGAT